MDSALAMEEEYKRLHTLLKEALAAPMDAQVTKKAITDIANLFDCMFKGYRDLKSQLEDMKHVVGQAVNNLDSPAPVVPKARATRTVRKQVAQPVETQQVEQGRINVIYARYGSEDTWIDIVEPFKRHCVRDQRVVVPRELNRIFTDPLHGLVKRVEALVEISGVRTVLVIHENTGLVFPKAKDIELLRTPPPAAPLGSAQWLEDEYYNLEYRVFWQGVGEQAMLECPIKSEQISMLATLLDMRLNDDQAAYYPRKKTIEDYMDWGNSLATVFLALDGPSSVSNDTWNLSSPHTILLTKTFTSMGLLMVDFFGSDPHGLIFWKLMDSLPLLLADFPACPGSTSTTVDFLNYWRNTASSGASQTENQPALTLPLFDSLRQVTFVMFLACKQASELQSN